MLRRFCTDEDCESPSCGHPLLGFELELGRFTFGVDGEDLYLHVGSTFVYFCWRSLPWLIAGGVFVVLAGESSPW